MAKTTKINQFARAVTARNDLETCERMLNTAHLYANAEIKPLIETALRIITEQRSELSDALAEARIQAQKVRTVFIKDVPVEVPDGYDVKRVTMCGQLRLTVHNAESGSCVAQICTANKDGSDVGGFVVWKNNGRGEQLPDLFNNEHSALSHFLSNYAGV